MLFGEEREGFGILDADAERCSRRERTLERDGAVGFVAGDGRAGTVALLFGDDRALVTDPFAVVLERNFLERFGENSGTFVLDGVGDGGRGFETGGYGAGTCDETRDVADGRACRLEKFEGVVEVFGRLSGEADDQVGAERKTAESFREVPGEGDVVFDGVAAVHRLECAFAPALHRDVDELVDALVCETVEQRFFVADDVARVSHAEADAVAAVHVREDLLREAGEVRADVKAVAGAVLPGQLDFEATVVDEGLDLVDDGVCVKAVEASFDEVRAAKSAGVEAAFFDVHDADEWRFAEDVLVAGKGLVAFIASSVLYRITRIKNN